MTTKEERERLYKMYCGFHNMIASARAIMDANVYHKPFDPFGDLDDSVTERKMNQVYDQQQGVQAALRSAWDYYVGLYSKWDLELAIQEGESRIGTLPYTNDN